MKKNYICIIEYPGSPYKKGQIITVNGDTDYLDVNPERFPDCFQAFELSLVENVVPYQICPICGGEGKIDAPSVRISKAPITCDVCGGKKIIPMYKIYELYQIRN